MLSLIGQEENENECNEKPLYTFLSGYIFFSLTVSIAGKNVGQQELSLITNGNAKWHSHFGHFLRN